MNTTPPDDRRPTEPRLLRIDPQHNAPQLQLFNPDRLRVFKKPKPRRPFPGNSGPKGAA